jgi:hypothetical protein
VRGDDPLQFAQQLDFILRLFEPLQARLQIRIRPLRQISAEAVENRIQLRHNLVEQLFVFA